MENYNRIIGENLNKIRTHRKLSLDQVSTLTSISKSMLSQIEKGTANPSVTTLWKLANGFKISFTELMSSTDNDIELIHSSDREPLLECNGKFRNYPVILFDPQKRFETYNIELDPGAELSAEPHLENTQEYITVMDGKLTITVNEKKYLLSKGDTLKFKADINHVYSNESATLCFLYMILYYPE